MPHYPKPFFRAARGRWYIQIDGHQHNLGPGTAEDADIAAAQLKLRLRQAKTKSPADPETEPIRAQSADGSDPDFVVGIIQLFMRDVRVNLAADTIEWYRYRLQLFIDHLFESDNGDLTVRDMRPHHVQTWVNRYPKLAPGSKRNYMRAVQRVFNWGEELGYLERSPVAKMKKPAGGKRERIITPAEYRKILDLTGSDEFRDLITTTWECGCRPQESLIVEARHVDLEGCRWFFPKCEAKGKKHDRVVYLNDRAMEITRRLMLAHPDGKLFRNSEGVAWTTDSVNCAFIRVQTRWGREQLGTSNTVHKRAKAGDKKAQLAAAATPRRPRDAQARAKGEKFCLYHLRHTWMNRLLTSGVDSLTVAVLAGHVDPSTLATTYQHLSQNSAYLLSEARRAS